jgi:hypothetical protein
MVHHINIKTAQLTRWQVHPHTSQSQGKLNQNLVESIQNGSKQRQNMKQAYQQTTYAFCLISEYLFTCMLFFLQSLIREKSKGTTNCDRTDCILRCSITYREPVQVHLQWASNHKVVQQCITFGHVPQSQSTNSREVSALGTFFITWKSIEKLMMSSGARNGFRKNQRHKQAWRNLHET